MATAMSMQIRMSSRPPAFDRLLNGLKNPNPAATLKLMSRNWPVQSRYQTPKPVTFHCLASCMIMSPMKNRKDEVKKMKRLFGQSCAVYVLHMP